jgi:hypothetical protein
MCYYYISMIMIKFIFMNIRFGGELNNMCGIINTKEDMPSHASVISTCDIDSLVFLIIVQ